MTLRALANFSIFSLFSLKNWRTSFHPSASEKAPESTFPTVFKFKAINLFTSASCVEERVEIVGNGCTLGLKCYPSSLRSNLRLSGPRIHGQTGLARSNTGSDTCIQYVLPDQGLKGAGSWSRMTHHLDKARPTAASHPRGPGKIPLGDEALPVGCHTETIVWTVFGHRLWRLCSAPQEIPYTISLLASFSMIKVNDNPTPFSLKSNVPINWSTELPVEMAPIYSGEISASDDDPTTTEYLRIRSRFYGQFFDR